MRLTSDDITALPQRYRAQLINSLPGFKPGILVGTTSERSQLNLAVISAVFHIGANPPLLGMILRPNPPKTERHTLENILATGAYTLNAFVAADAEKAHQTAARYPRDGSEFSACGFTPCHYDNFIAPFVSESPLQIGCELREHQPLTVNGTHLIIGQIALLSVDDSRVRADGSLDLAAMNLAAVAGLDSYHPVGPGVQFSYPKPGTTPEQR